MSKNLGPTHKPCRRAGVKLCTAAKCPLTRRNAPPGVHGASGYPRLTGYGMQMMEKQKAKHVYGMRERQFANLVAKARALKGDTKEHVLNMLELRLDNVLYRMGFAPTRPQARQMVSHGHVMVNGRRVSIASALLKVGAVVSLKAGSTWRTRCETAFKSTGQPQGVSWVSLDIPTCTSKIVALPASFKEMKPLFDLKTVVEFYGR